MTAPVPESPRKRPARRNKPMAPVIVRMPSVLIRGLEKAAREQGVSFSHYVRDVLASHGVSTK